ncbi:MAG TPA: hypothetical protein VIJ92_17015 [Ginsengibacter sp.]
MKKLLAFILLLSHMNTSMLLPQVPEDDVYDKMGNQLDDINSIVELVMVKLGIDHYADDEDDDQGQNFHLVKVFEYCFQPVFSEINDNGFAIDKKAMFGVYKESKIPDISFDIIIPPPKATT